MPISQTELTTLAATPPPPHRRGISHSNSYLRYAMPQLRGELEKLGIAIEWSGLTNIVADNSLYAGWQEIYRAAHGQGFCPKTETASAAEATTTSGAAQIADYLESLPKPGAATAAPSTPAVITDEKIRQISVAVFGEARTNETLREVPFQHGQDAALARRDALLRNFALAGLEIPGASHSYLTVGSGGQKSAIRRAAAVKAQAVIDSLTK